MALSTGCAVAVHGPGDMGHGIAKALRARGRRVMAALEAIRSYAKPLD